MGTASTYQADPGHIDHTPVSAVAVGDVVVLGDLFCVADRPIPAGKLGALAIEGAFILPKDSSTLSAGDTVYWTGSAISSSGGSGTTRAGWAIADAATGATTCKVLINYG